MKILRVINSLDLRFGGVAASLWAITPVLAARGHEITCVSVDAPGDVTEDPLLGAKVHPLGPQKTSFGYSARLLTWLRRHAREYDVVLVDGLWQYHGVAVHRALKGTGVPYFVFPHGMFDPWFKRTYPVKHAKKTLFWWLFQRAIIRDAAAVLYTCEEERVLAQETFPAYEATERVVVFGTARPTFARDGLDQVLRTALPQLAQGPYWLYLGRLHEKKGVDMLIAAYAKLALERTTLPTLVIAGPPQDPGYVEKLQAAAAQLPAHARVVWTGMLHGEQKWAALAHAEAMVLPSHQENFGIVVAEALSYGTPVLISNKVNIWREVQADGAGIIEDDTPEGTEQLLRRHLAQTPEEKSAMRAAASASFAERYEIGKVADSLVSTLETFVTARFAGEDTEGARSGAVRAV